MKKILVILLIMLTSGIAQGAEIYDVVVVGGGSSGVIAAVQAARIGVRVAIVEESGWIGGQTTGGGVSTMDDNYRTRFGLYGEFIERGRKYYEAHGTSVATGLFEKDTLGFEPAIGQKIFYEMEQIEQLINDSSPLFALCKRREPDFVERCGIALILQSFYNGIENIMLMIYKNRKDSLLTGTKWHKDLLINIFEIKVFRDELKILLEDYMQFRHFIRHAYGFQLKWEKMKLMFFDMNIVWEKIKEDLKSFLENNKNSPNIA